MDMDTEKTKDKLTTTSYKEERGLLKREIFELSDTISSVDYELEYYNRTIGEKPSIRNTISTLGAFSIGIGLLAKLFFKLMVGSNDIALSLGFLRFQVTDFLGVYCTIPVVFTILFVSTVNRMEYNSNHKKIEILEQLLECLTEELRKKKALLVEMENRPISGLDDEYMRILKNRREKLATLGNFRRQLIAHHKAGTLKSYLKTLGFDDDTIEEGAVVAEKLFWMRKAKKR